MFSIGSFPCSSPRRQRGFTLIELLIVIAIISVLMTAGAIGIGGLSSGKGVSSAVATSEATFDEARSIAVGKNTKARVLIDVTDPKDNANYLRRMLIAYYELDSDGVPKEEWYVANRDIRLPDQTFFSREYSSKDLKGGGGQLDEMSLDAGVRENYRGKYLYYEFNGEGICTTPGASFVVGAGVRPAQAEKPMVTASTKRDFGGFVIWRNGRTSVFRSPEQVNIPSDVKNF